ncbi:MAG: permease [Butyrivibrio sp.]|nr:permease [Butyrivibrio sp.]
MRNPLIKRLPRELKGDFRKYLVLFLLLTLTIGFVSGMFVANDSMLMAAADALVENNVEDGHFDLDEKPTDKLIEAIEDEGVSLYEQFYKELEEDVDGDGNPEADIRVFIVRQQVNTACLMYGKMPEKNNEIAIDRMHADNRGIKVGDEITIGDTKMTVSGLVASSDYSTLFQDNSDVMFDALTFNIGFVTRDAYDQLDAKEIYQYAYKYDLAPADDEEEKEKADDLMTKIAVLAATGTLFTDEDEAKEFADEAEVIEDKADILEQAADIKEVVDEKTAEIENLKNELESAKSLEQMQSIQVQLQEKATELQEYVDDESNADILDKAQDILDEDIDFDYWSDVADTLEENENKLTDFVPAYLNSAINFTVDDMSHDKVMGKYLLYILVVVLAFIFAITSSSIIISEAAVIGTLRASGYTRAELVRHYVSMPIIVTLAAAIFGNILGYSVFKEVVVMMYYNSYSLPTYTTIWNADAFIQTTLGPVIIMIIVNFIIVSSKLRLDPLRFLRRDLSISKRKKAMRLPRWSFLNRFRLRILFQNLSSYCVLFLGIIFVMMLLAFAIGFPDTLKNYQNKAADMMLCNYQYILKSTQDEDDNEITTSEASAEKFSMTTLETIDGVRVGEEVSVYGYIEGSNYIDISDDLTSNQVYISKAYADKFNIMTPGDGVKGSFSDDVCKITLKEQYSSKTYEFDVVGIYDYEGGIALFMPNDNFNDLFDNEEDDFTGFMSSEEITDIDDEYIYTLITKDDILKMVNQLDHSMGGFMDYFAYACILAAALIIYLLTKLIIEKNATSISMVKVLGYTNNEISSLYVRLTTYMVIIFSCGAAFIGTYIISLVWKAFMNSYPGWYEFYIAKMDIVKMIVMMIIAYLIVSLFDMRRIKRIPLSEALKNVE